MMILQPLGRGIYTSTRQGQLWKRFWDGRKGSQVSAKPMDQSPDRIGKLAVVRAEHNLPICLLALAVILQKLDLH